MVSILILTLNEEQNLPACLEAVRWSNDVLVVDSFSKDRTVEIAKQHGARVIQKDFEDFASQRNFGLAQGNFRNDWVFHLDADEIVTPGLAEEIRKVVTMNAKCAFRVASRMHFRGRWLRHAGLYPSYQVRLGKRDSLRFVQVGHGQREDLSRELIGTLSQPLVHNSFAKGISDWMEKHNRYSSSEAEESLSVLGTGSVSWTSLLSTDPTVRRRALKSLSFRIPCRPTLRFLYMYIVRLGFLDGVAGYHYCRLLSIYEYLSVMKLKEIRRRQAGLAL
jgi:glycosyltransferase involved in cell wall biosynthesis